MSETTTPTDGMPPHTRVIILAARRLYDACHGKHYARPEGTRGRDEYENALIGLRDVLQRTMYYRDEVIP